MYIVFDKLGLALACNDYPELHSIEYAKQNKSIFNKWEIVDIKDDGKFRLGFKNYIGMWCYTGCCDNSKYVDIYDFEEYECYNCGTMKRNESEKEGVFNYLGNSRTSDILWCIPSIPHNVYIIEVPDEPNTYMFIDDKDIDRYNKYKYVLHVADDGHLSDLSINSVSRPYHDIKYRHIIFVDDIDGI